MTHRTNLHGSERKLRAREPMAIVGHQSRSAGESADKDISVRRAPSTSVRMAYLVVVCSRATSERCMELPKGRQLDVQAHLASQLVWDQSTANTDVVSRRSGSN